MNFAMLLKKKAILIPIVVFVFLFLVLVALNDEDDDLDEIETKFPLEDYLFQDSKYEELERLKREKEELERQKQKGYLEINEEMRKMQEALKAQEEALKAQKQQMLKDLRDAQGNKIELDENGRPILYDENGNRIYYDENSNPYTLDENGNKVSRDKNDPVYTKDGNKIEKDENNNLILYDENGNKTILTEDGKKITTDKDGNKIVEDSNGNVSVYDKDGNKISSSNKNNSANGKNPELFYDEEGNLIGDRVALENQKFDSSKASDEQKNINDLLASRFEIQNPYDKEGKIEYGVDSFSNLDSKDVASNEHKLLRTITADKLIPAFLVRPISSQVGGNVVAQVETNIYAAMGRAVLIPKGSKVIGFYQNDNKVGEYRLQIVWTRIITPHGVNIMLTDAKGADVKGYIGLVGEVHKRDWERYGIPMSLSTLSNALLIGVNSATSKSGSGGAGDLTNAYMQSQIFAGMQKDIGSIIQRIAQEQMKVQPIITIKEGSRIFIALNQDIFIPRPKNNETLARFFREVVQEEENKAIKDSAYDVGMGKMDIDIALQNELHFGNTPSGTLNGTIIYDSQQMQVIGSYKMKNKKVVFKIEHLSANGRLYSLKQQPSITRILKHENSKLLKGALLTFQNASPHEFSEFAKMLKDDENNKINPQLNPDSQSQTEMPPQNGEF